MKNKEHETFELTEDMFANWDKENEKWYKKALPLIESGEWEIYIGGPIT